MKRSSERVRNKDDWGWRVEHGKFCVRGRFAMEYLREFMF